ncbi:SDR family oxidoreductase [Zavarzinia sp. CC-PAN008]|uniref:SDR family oxidoreductase n=1 Tax=Zavarzinia sp. CC-PAN008 TaxID=3243332 RepID=UPI003F746A83
MPDAAPPRPAILITGAAQGIGLAIAKLFAAKGWFVGLTDIAKDKLPDALAAIGPGNGWTAQLDVRDRGQWRKVLDEFVQAANGRMDVLVNNAGLTSYTFLDEMTDEEIDRIVDVNLKGVLNGARAGLPILQRTYGSCLVNIASCAALYGSPNYSVYSASKAAVRALSQALDIEWQKYDIHVRCILPWSLETPILDTASEKGSRTIRDDIKVSGQAIYPVEDAAEAVWAAVRGDALEAIVGQAGIDMATRVRAEPDAVRADMRAAYAPPKDQPQRL